jgi:hypothetical protein
MRIIKLDASQWNTPADFYSAILLSLKAPDWHGKSVNALIDSMVYGGINGIEPPYKIWLVGTAGLPEKVRGQIDGMVTGINAQRGTKEITFQIDP